MANKNETPMHQLERQLADALDTIAALQSEGIERDAALIELAAMLAGGAE